MKDKQEALVSYIEMKHNHRANQKVIVTKRKNVKALGKKIHKPISFASIDRSDHQTSVYDIIKEKRFKKKYKDINIGK